MMTHLLFKKNYLGKLNDYDGVHGPQCVDLIKLYTRNVFGVTLGSFGGSAYTGWQNVASTFTADRWERIEYKKGMTAMQGDLVFFDKTKRNKYGHVAIVENALALRDLYVIEQNAKTGTGKGLPGDEISIGTYKNYKGCLGWYRLKEEKIDPETERVQKQITNFMKAVGISDAGMDEYITKRNVLTMIVPVVIEVVKEIEAIRSKIDDE